jgi:hypothetical protein
MRQRKFRVFTLKNEERNSFKQVICFTEDTRNGFKHVAIMEGTNENTSANYINRTWESFEYETVLNKLINEYTYLLDYKIVR